MLDKIVRDNVRRLTKDVLGLAELSRKLGMGDNGIMSYLQQERSWSLEEVETVAKYLDVEVMDLLLPRDVAVDRQVAEDEARFGPLDPKILTKKILTTGEVAQVCQVAPRTVSKWFDSGRLRGYRIPGSQDRRIPVGYVVDFLLQHKMPLRGLDPALASKD